MESQDINPFIGKLCKITDKTGKVHIGYLGQLSPTQYQSDDWSLPIWANEDIAIVQELKPHPQQIPKWKPMAYKFEPYLKVGETVQLSQVLEDRDFATGPLSDMNMMIMWIEHPETFKELLLEM